MSLRPARRIAGLFRVATENDRRGFAEDEVKDQEDEDDREGGDGTDSQFDDLLTEVPLLLGQYIASCRACRRHSDCTSLTIGSAVVVAAR